MLIDDSWNYSRLMMHEFYNQDNIDILFVGASHCVRSVDPFILDEKTGKNTFLACSSDQEVDSSLALVKEALRMYKPEKIFMEISSTLAQRTGNFKERESLTATYAVSDYMPLTFHKLSLLINASSADHYVNSFWPARRNWQMITDFNYIGNVLKTKSTSKYKDYSDYYVNSNMKKVGAYRGKGYAAYIDEYADHEFFVRYDYRNVNTEKISDDWKKTILDMVDYCNANHVDIVLFATPVSNFELSAVKNYDEYVSFIYDLVQTKNVQFIDFNLVSEDYFPYIQSNYSDGNHLNATGAEKFSLILSEYLNHELPEDALLLTVEEKLEKASPEFFGIAYADDYQENARVINLVSNPDNYFEYRVELITGSDDDILLQDYDLNHTIFVPFEQVPDAEVRVTYREKGSEDGTAISYDGWGVIY